MAPCGKNSLAPTCLNASARMARPQRLTPALKSFANVRMSLCAAPLPTISHPYHPCAQKSTAQVQLGAAFLGQDPDDYFKETVLEGGECPSDDPCFARDTLALLPSGERVPMASLKAGDLVMDGPSSVARVIVNQHREAAVPPSPLYHPLAVTTNTRAATLSPQPIHTEPVLPPGHLQVGPPRARAQPGMWSSHTCLDSPEPVQTASRQCPDNVPDSVQTASRQRRDSGTWLDLHSKVS